MYLMKILVKSLTKCTEGTSWYDDYVEGCTEKLIDDINYFIEVKNIETKYGKVSSEDLNFLYHKYLIKYKNSYYTPDIFNVTESRIYV